MICTKDVLFIHIGKTGGISITDYLCNTLQGPIISATNSRLGNDKIFGNEIITEGHRHFTLEESLVHLKKYNITYDSLEVIFAVIRNPYDYEVSLWNHYIKRYRRGNLKESKRVKAVQSKSFDFFVKQNFLHRPEVKIKDYLTLSGKVPDKMNIILFENMSSEIQKIISPYQLKKAPFPHKNKSIIKKNPLILTKDQKELIYKKNKWVFDNQFYQK